MKLVLTTIFAATMVAAFANDTATTIAANAMLKDGSCVKGEFCTKRITGATIFAERLELDPATVKSLAFDGSSGEAKVELLNGDKFAMTVANEDFKINSLIGDLAIPRANFRSISLHARKAAGDGGDGLVFYCTFDDEAAITSPAVGPKGVFLRGQFHEGKVGQSLMTTVYAQNATFEFPPNFLNTSGCIEFWAKILKPSPYIGNGGDPRLFTISQKSTQNTICTLDIVSNNGSGNSGFATWTVLGNMANLRGCRTLRYEELFPDSDYRDWHHYAIIWDKDGISSLTGAPRTALLVDGKFIPDVQGHAKSEDEASAILSSTLLLCFTQDPRIAPEHSTKSPFLIDEFKIWNRPMTDFDLK